MHASIVVFSALVAVSSAQYWGHWGAMPLNPITGTPIDTPEVMHAKHFHFAAKANAFARSGYLMRKRREAPAAAAPEAHQEAAPIDENSKVEKRSPYVYGYAGYYPYARTLAYPAGWGFWRKKRDASEEPSEVADSNAEVSNRETRQVFLTYPYSFNPYFGYWRKKRDVSEEPVSASNDEVRDKRQYGLGYGYGWGGYYRSIYSSPWLWRKKRDLSSEEEIQETADPAQKEKRQVLLGAGYGWGLPLMRSSWGYGYPLWY